MACSMKRLVYYKENRRYYWLQTHDSEIGSIPTINKQEFEDLKENLKPLDKNHSLVEILIFIVTATITVLLLLTH